MRRLYFKSAKLGKTTQSSTTTLHQQQQQQTHVPKVWHNRIFAKKIFLFRLCAFLLIMKLMPFLHMQVMVMGTSVASTAETTINTSTESASTLATNVTGTDTSTCDSLDLGREWCTTFFFILILILTNEICEWFLHTHSHPGDSSGQIEPLLSSFDEPAPLTAIPTNSLTLNRLDEEESNLIEDEDDTDVDTDADSRRRREQEDEDAKIPLLTSPEVSSFPPKLLRFEYYCQIK